MKIIELINAKRAIMAFTQEKLSPKLSYKLLKFINKIEYEENFYNKKISELIDKYGERDENNQLIHTDTEVKIQEDKMADCNLELKEIENVEVEPPDMKFTLDELSEVKLSVQDMFLLQDFIEE